MKKYEFIGKTKDEAMNQALTELKIQENKMLVVEKEQKAGLFKGKKVLLEIVMVDDVIDYIKESIKKITKAMGIESNVEVKERNDILNIILYSDNNNILIGKNGRTIDALSVIMRQMVQNEIGCSFKFNIDVAEYKMKQQRRIESLAKRVAREVANTKIDAKLDPMNSYERRIVHNILNDSDVVYTESEGEEPNRYVVIKARENK